MSQAWIDTLWRVGPLVLAAFRITAGLAPVIVSAIAFAERIGGASGPQKKEIALQQFDAGIAAYNRSAGNQGIDPIVAHDAAANVIDLVVATINVWAKHAPELQPGARSEL